MMERILIYNLSIKVLNYSDLYKTVQIFPLNSFLRQLSGDLQSFTRKKL